MKKILLLTAVLGLACFGLAKPASAQTIPNVSGLTPFTAETNFMSLVGYVRWQYFVENSNWISRTEAAALIRSQTGATTASASVE